MPPAQPEDIVRVKNGFQPDWMPSGYRDVKVNPIVSEHLCEIQLHLREFFYLKAGQHKVYEWARELNVTTEMHPSYLFENQSSEVRKEMIRLAGQNWRGTQFCLEFLYFDAAQYANAHEGYSKVTRVKLGSWHIFLPSPRVSRRSCSPRQTRQCWQFIALIASF